MGRTVAAVLVLLAALAVALIIALAFAGKAGDPPRGDTPRDEDGGASRETPPFRESESMRMTLLRRR